MSLLRKLLGRKGEDRAARHLSSLGYRVLERNYRTSHGEIDIIALDRENVVFIEVKTRSGAAYGAPELAVDRRKQERMVKAALGYLKRKQLHQMACRFDVVAISGNGPDDIQLIRNAFEMERARY
jgi:putative endonuclease